MCPKKDNEQGIRSKCAGKFIKEYFQREKRNFDIQAVQLVPSARKYPATILKYILINRGVVVIGHPPQSPDLATAASSTPK